MEFYIKDESNKPSLNEGQRLEEILSYNSELNKIVCEYKIIDLPEVSFEFSPLKMEIEIEKRGKELGIDGLALLDSIIEQAGMTRMYKRAAVLNSDDPRVIQLLTALNATFGWTADDQKSILLQCRI